MSGREVPVMLGLRCSSSRGRVDVEQFEYAGRQLRGRRDDRRPGGAGRDQDEPAERFEDETARGSSRGATGKSGHGRLGLDGPTDLALDEAEDEKSHADDAEQRLDAPVVLQE